ncbi:hypothetical protein ABEX38_30105 [Priestia megaterium]
MRLVLQGTMTPEELAKAVNEIVQDTFKKAEVEGQVQYIHNPVVEMNLKIEGHEEPQLLVDDEKNAMLTVHQGVKDGELVEYVEVDRSELVAKFNELMDNEIEAIENKDPELLEFFEKQEAEKE